MPRRPEKSLLTAYVLWLFLGLWGAHRFYLGKWFTGLVYTMSFGLYFIGWALDGLFLWWMVAHYNKQAGRRKYEDEFEDEEELPALHPTYAKSARRSEDYDDAVPARRSRRRDEPVEAEILPEGPPEWARTHSFRPIEFLLRIGFFLIAPGIFTIVALMLEQWELLVLAGIAMVVGGFIGNVDALLLRYPMLGKVPVLGNALHHLHEFTQYYRRSRPFHFLYYMLYPITCPLALLFSEHARREFKVFARLIGGMLLIVVARIGFGYQDIFPPHLGISDAFLYAFLLCFFLLGMIALFLIPTVNTAMTLSVMGRTWQLRFLIFLGLVSSLPMGIAYYYISGSSASFVDHQLLGDRLKTDTFRQELREEATMFLSYWQQHSAELPQQPTSVVQLHDKLTEKWRRSMAGIVPKRETNAFEVFAWKTPGDKVGLTLALTGYNSASPAKLLFVQAPDGQCYSDWGQLPAEWQRHFEEVGWGRMGVRGFMPKELMDNRWVGKK